MCEKVILAIFKTLLYLYMHYAPTPNYLTKMSARILILILIHS